MVFIFRLSSTMVKNGYLPVDATGDWVYQASDIASLLLVFQLLFFVHKRYKDTYQSSADTMPIWNVAPVAFLLGFCAHGNLNHSPFFNKVGAIIMAAHSLQLLFSADFMYHYFQWQASNRCSAGCGKQSTNMVLPMSGMMDI